MKGIECAFQGRLGRDARLKQTSMGKTFLTFSVIVPMRNDAEEWVNISAWSESIADLAPNLKQGVEVYVQGKLEQRHWQGAEGPRSGLSVSATKVEPLGLIGRAKPKGPAKPRGKAKVDSQAPLAFADGTDCRQGDQIPF